MANENNTAVAEIHENTDFMMGLVELKKRADMVTEIKRQIMKKDTHYGVIPGCGDKPTLLKNGAELLCMAFKLAPEAKVEVADLGNGHREYTVTTTLVSIVTGTPIAAGLGSCSTMESKYRYRNVADFEVTGQPIPKDAKEKKQEYRKKGFAMKKVDGQWEWVRFKDTQKQENPDIADMYNTVLKMASKRSLIDATLKATGGSCEFTQDLEDMKQDTAPQYSEYEDVTDQAAPDYNTNTSPLFQQAPTAPKTATKKSVDENTKKFMEGMKGLWSQEPKIYQATMKELGFKSANNVPPERRGEVFNTIVDAMNKPKSAPTAMEQQNDLFDNGEDNNG